MFENKIYRVTHSPQSNVAEGGTVQEQMDDVAREFINNLGRVASFFGFNRLMGQLWGVLFLSPEPLTLDEMKDRLNSSKGNVSINIRALERWGLVHQVYKWADRRDYYEAEPDIWKAVSGILQDRERKESQQMIDSLNNSIETIAKLSKSASAPEAVTADFYLKRMEILRQLFEFGDLLLGMMVQGGAVNFGEARNITKGEGISRRTADALDEDGDALGLHEGDDDILNDAVIR